MQLLSSYTLPPGQCSTCGGCDTPVIDTERTVDDGYSRLYICHLCIKSMANEFGFLPPDKLLEQNDKILALKAALKERIATAEELKGLLDERDEALRVIAEVRKPAAPRKAPAAKKAAA